MKNRYSVASKAMTIFFVALCIVWLIPIFEVLINSFKENAYVNTDAFALPNSESFVGMACVVQHNGVVSADDAVRIIENAQKHNAESAKRILIKGDAEVSLQAAEVFAASGILLLGNESQTVGPQDAPMAVHLALLSAGVVLLEGIRLADVPDGVYLLNAAPLNLQGADGSPCRAVLISDYNG